MVTRKLLDLLIGGIKMLTPMSHRHASLYSCTLELRFHLGYDKAACDTATMTRHMKFSQIAQATSCAGASQ